MLFAARRSAAAASTVLRRGLVVQPSAAGGARPQVVAPRGQAIRRMGGDGHSPAPHPSQPKQAFLFNEGPGPRKVEIWEPITSIVYWSTLFILVIGLSSAPETRIKEWAAEEAETRLARIEDGKDIEYGKVYHAQLLSGGFREPSAVDADSPPAELENEE